MLLTASSSYADVKCKTAPETRIFRRPFESGFCKRACRDAMRVLEFDHRLRLQRQDGRGL